MGKLEPITGTAPAHWASYLINGDASGLDDADRALADRFVAYMEGPIVSTDGETWFSRYCDAPGVHLAGEMARYTALVPTLEKR